MSKFSVEDIELLKKYVSDPDGNIFCIKNLDGIVGAVYARYSRAPGGFKDTLLKEFVKQGNLDAKKAEKLIARVLIAFGDDSVGELEGAHLSFEEISILATKEVEERRIGGSPIEQSTRYVFYDQIDEQGKYRYYFPSNIKNSSSSQGYQETMDFIFKTYCDLIEPMKDYYSKLKPLEEAEYDINGDGQKEKINELDDEKHIKAFRITYKSDLRTKACDTLRNLLPIATRTNVGLFGNGRFYQNMLTGLYTSPYIEANEMAQKAHSELNKIIPQYVTRAKKNEYLWDINQKMRVLAKELFNNINPENNKDITLLNNGEDRIVKLINAKVREGKEMSAEELRSINQEEFDNLTISCMLYPYLKHPLEQIRNIVRELPDEKKKQIITVYVGDRKNRRNKPYRAFEYEYSLIFDLVTDWGTYKDLMRHRINSQLRQLFSPKLGFSMPQDIVDAGFSKQAQECHDRAEQLYDKLINDFPFEASYTTLHGSRVRWLLGMNTREAFHLLELRTTPQGHTKYRKVSQKMHKELEKVSEWRAKAMKFVDHNDYYWARADSEAKQRVKERQLEEKFNNN